MKNKILRLEKASKAGGVVISSFHSCQLNDSTTQHLYNKYLTKFRQYMVLEAAVQAVSREVYDWFLLRSFDPHARC